MVKSKYSGLIMVDHIHLNDNGMMMGLSLVPLPWFLPFTCFPPFRILFLTFSVNIQKIFIIFTIHSAVNRWQIQWIVTQKENALWCVSLFLQTLTFSQFVGLFSDKSLSTSMLQSRKWLVGASHSLSQTVDNNYIWKKCHKEILHLLLIRQHTIIIIL